LAQDPLCESAGAFQLVTFDRAFDHAVADQLRAVIAANRTCEVEGGVKIILTLF
jgi:hypothetical protein